MIPGIIERVLAYRACTQALSPRDREKTEQDRAKIQLCHPDRLLGTSSFGVCQTIFHSGFIL